MTDYMIGGVLVLIMVLAIASMVKKKKSGASCCGSGTYVAKSRKLKSIACKKTYQVEDMHCQNCVNRIMEAVQDLGGTSAVVDMKKGMLTVSMEKEIKDSIIIAAVEKRGYGIKRV